MSHQQELAISRATASLQAALEGRGLDAATAGRYAGLLIRQPGVAIGREGRVIRYQGRTFQPEAFAHSGFADWAVGIQAKNANQALLTGDPTYQQQLAVLDLTRQYATAGLDDAERRSIIEYGSGAAAGKDANLAQQAEANPFSIQASLQRADQQRQLAARQAAARLGVSAGGGLVSALGAASRQHLSETTSAAETLQRTIAQINEQRGLAAQSYGLGQTQALMDTQARLQQSGLFHPLVAPSLRSGPVAFIHPPRRRLPAPPPPPRSM